MKVSEMLKNLLGNMQALIDSIKDNIAIIIIISLFLKFISFCVWAGDRDTKKRWKK